MTLPGVAQIGLALGATTRPLMVIVAPLISRTPTLLITTFPFDIEMVFPCPSSIISAPLPPPGRCSIQRPKLMNSIVQIALS